MTAFLRFHSKASSSLKSMFSCVQWSYEAGSEEQRQRCVLGAQHHHHHNHRMQHCTGHFARCFGDGRRSGTICALIGWLYLNLEMLGALAILTIERVRLRLGSSKAPNGERRLLLFYFIVLSCGRACVWIKRNPFSMKAALKCIPWSTSGETLYMWHLCRILLS